MLDEGVIAPPSEKVVRRARLSLDTALSVQMRAEFLGNHAKVSHLFLWCDSSPQGARNWLLSQVHLWTPEQDEKMYYDAWMQLQRRRARLQTGVLPDDSEEEEEEEEEEELKQGEHHNQEDIFDDDGTGGCLPAVARRDDAAAAEVVLACLVCPTRGFQKKAMRALLVSLLHNATHSISNTCEPLEVRNARRLVCGAWQYHCLMPCALGSGREKVEHKAACLLQQLWHEVGSTESLESLLAERVVSCTSDMGTELHLADLPCGSTGASAYLPEHLQGVDIEDCTCNKPCPFILLCESANAKEHSKYEKAKSTYTANETQVKVHTLCNPCGWQRPNVHRSHSVFCSVPLSCSCQSITKNLRITQCPRCEGCAETYWIAQTRHTHMHSSKDACGATTCSFAIPLDDNGMGSQQATATTLPRRMLFGRMVPVAGVQHILHNLTKAHLHTAMLSWGDFFPLLAEIEKLLSKRWMRERFVHHNLSGASSALRKLLLKDFPKLREWRWGIICEVLARVLQVKEAFQTHWNAAAFLSLETKAQRMDINVELITKASESDFFWAFAEMCHCVQQVLDGFSKWSEQCQCCTSAQRSRKRSYSMFSTCPLSGKQAVALASAIVNDFLAALSYVRSGLELKLAFWQTLPWKLAGVCNADLSLARMCAAECIQQYDSAAALGEDMHHAVANKLLGQDTEMRTMLERFLAGTPLETPLLKQLLPLALMPTGERAIEMRHAVVNTRLAGKHRKHPTTVSLANRIVELEARFRAHPECFPQLCDAFGLTRSLKRMCTLFQLDRNQTVNALLQNQHQSYVFTPSVTLLYRTDLEEQYADPRMRRYNAEARSRVAKLTKEIQAATRLPSSNFSRFACPMECLWTYPACKWGHASLLKHPSSEQTFRALLLRQAEKGQT
eukprot:6472209-Amphidinium_carterae.2